MVSLSNHAVSAFSAFNVIDRDGPPEGGHYVRISKLRLQAREEPIHHHLRDAADQTLSDACDRTAGMDGPAHVDRRRLADGAKRDHRTAFHESGASLSFDHETV